MCDAPRDIYAARTKYGYWLNISHPKVETELKRYCQSHNIYMRYPMSDSERQEFEVQYLKSHGINHQTPEWVRFQYFDTLIKMEREHKAQE